MYYHWIIPQPLLQNSRSAPVELTVRFADDMGTGASSTKRNNIGGQRPIFRRSLHEGGLHGQGRRRGFQFQRHCQTGWKCSQGSFSLYCSKCNITILYFITNQVQSECAWLLLLVFRMCRVITFIYIVFYIKLTLFVTFMSWVHVRVKVWLTHLHVYYSIRHEF